MRCLIALAAGILFLGDIQADEQPPYIVFSQESGGEFLPAGIQGESGTVQHFSAPELNLTHAVRVQTLVWPKFSWDLQLKALVPVEIKKADKLLVTLWVRCAKTTDETGEGKFGVVLEQANQPYGKLLDVELGVGREWKRFDFPIQSPCATAANGASLNLRLGGRPQTLELAGALIENYGPDQDLATLPVTRFTYAGREPNATWRTAAAERIERLRKGDFVIRVLDHDGKPVVDAQLSANLSRHAFAFGTSVSASPLLSNTADSREYCRILTTHFNTGVPESELKWGSYETDHKRAANMVDWLRDHGLTVRGHNVIWPGWTHLPPGWSYVPPDVVALKNDPSAMRARIQQRFREVITPFVGKISEWDVINEPIIHTDVVDVLGKGEIAEWMKLARSLDPNAKLFINEATLFEDGSIQKRLFDLAKDLKAQNVPLDGLGIQSHYGSTLTSPEVVLANIDRFAELGLNLQVTEFDIDSKDNELKADYLRDFLTLCFSHPAVTGFTMWGFWEGAHWRPASALWRRDWSLTPMGEAYVQLMTRTFHTRAEGATGAEGSFNFRGFYGDYDVVTKRGSEETTSHAHFAGPNDSPLVVRLP